MLQRSGFGNILPLFLTEAIITFCVFKKLLKITQSKNNKTLIDNTFQNFSFLEHLSRMKAFIIQCLLVLSTYAGNISSKIVGCTLLRGRLDTNIQFYYEYI